MEDQETIFLRFRKGTRLNVPPNAASKFKEVIPFIGDDQALRSSIKEMTDWCGWGISAESTWAQVILELVREFGKVMPHKKDDWAKAVQEVLLVSCDLNKLL